MTLLVAFLICFSAVVFTPTRQDSAGARLRACPSGQWNFELLLVSLRPWNGIGHGTRLRLNWRTARPDTPPDDTLGQSPTGPTQNRERQE